MKHRVDYKPKHA